jgi:predicted transposase/invertase (TIGR01784 family)
MKGANAKEEKKSRQKYAELLCDFMFKRLFGSKANKDVLIGFLNMILEDHEIVEVDFIPTEHLGLTDEDRKVVFDISCECQDGETLIIEMQKGYQTHFRKRALYYTTYPINEQARDAKDRFLKEKAAGKIDAKFDWDYNLKPVTVVAILNFRFSHQEDWPQDKFRSSYRLREDGNHEVMTDVLRFVFLELGRFRKRIWELETVFDKWMYLLRHMHEMVEIPKEFDDSLFRRLFMLAEINNFTAEEYKQYQKSLENMGDYQNIINTAVEEAEIRGRAAGLEQGLERGREEGREEGRVEGRMEGRVEGREEGSMNKAVEIARKLMENGMSQEDAAAVVGVSVESLEGDC